MARRFTMILPKNGGYREGKDRRQKVQYKEGKDETEELTFAILQLREIWYD